MLVNTIAFINMFFVPVLPLYFLYRKEQKSLQFHLEILFQYCIITACNIPFTKAFVFVINQFVGKSISVDSGYYTLLSLLTASLIYVLCAFNKAHPDKRLWIRDLFLEFPQKLKRKKVKGMLKDLAPAFLILFSGCFMLFFFEPLLAYSTNMNDFWFDFRIMIWPLLGMFVCFLVVGFLMLFAIYICNLLFSEGLVVYKGIVLIGFIGFFLLYLQGNWLSGNLPGLTGEKIIWENYGKVENVVLVCALMLLGIILIIGVSMTKLDRVIHYTTMGSCVIFIMLFASLIPTMITNDAFKSKDTFRATTENFNTVSSNKNFLIFLVDAVDSRTLYNVMNKDDDFREMFEDFTYYPDTLGIFPFTRDSIPAILTGVINHNEAKFLNYSSSAYNQSPFFKKLVENAYTINLYSSGISWSGNREFPVDNATSIYDMKVDFVKFTKQEMKYILFKYLPYAIKKYSKIDTLDFDLCQVTTDGRTKYNWKNRSVFNSIHDNENLNFQDKNYFHFIHCEGAHVPFNMDKYLNSIKDRTYEDKVAASLTMIKAYLQRLKNNNSYDNSVIVIMSDHGHYDALDSESDKVSYDIHRLARCNPILFIKGMDEKHEMKESVASVSYMDLQDAFCDLIDGKRSDELFTDLGSDRIRTFIWYLYNKETHMVEYATNGKAYEFEKFFPTGNVYDLVS